MVPSANLYEGLLEWQRTHRGRWRQARAAGAYGGLERWTTWRGQRMFCKYARVSKALDWGGRWEQKAEGRNDDGLGKAGEERRVTRGQTQPCRLGPSEYTPSHVAPGHRWRPSIAPSAFCPSFTLVSFITRHSPSSDSDCLNVGILRKSGRVWNRLWAL